MAQLLRHVGDHGVVPDEGELVLQVLRDHRLEKATRRGGGRQSESMRCSSHEPVWGGGGGGREGRCVFDVVDFVASSCFDWRGRSLTQNTPIDRDRSPVSRFFGGAAFV